MLNKNERDKLKAELSILYDLVDRRPEIYIKVPTRIKEIETILNADNELRDKRSNELQRRRRYLDD